MNDDAARLLILAGNGGKNKYSFEERNQSDTKLSFLYHSIPLLWRIQAFR
jgi:hypothetical protein